MQKLASLSIFFPAYNDSLSIPKLISKANTVAEKVSYKHEIMVINDGSQDNTARVLEKLQKQYKHVRIITHETNQGYGAALRSGFKSAQYEWVFYTDGDGQYDPAELVKLVSQTSKNVDIVNGYKIKRSDSLLRVVIGALYNHVSRLLYALPISDVDCDFRLIRNSKLRKINLTSSSGMICLELILKLKKQGARFAQVPVHHYPRKHGKSQFLVPKHLISTFVEYVGFFFSTRQIVK